MIRIEFLVKYLYHTKRIATRCAACIGGSGKTRFGHFVSWGRHRGVERIPRKCRMKPSDPKRIGIDQSQPAAAHILLIFAAEGGFYLYIQPPYILVFCIFAYLVLFSVWFILCLIFFFLISFVVFYQYLKIRLNKSTVYSFYYLGSVCCAVHVCIYTF